VDVDDAVEDHHQQLHPVYIHTYIHLPSCIHTHYLNVYTNKHTYIHDNILQILQSYICIDISPNTFVYTYIHTYILICA
jgi:hypothetical protein